MSPLETLMNAGVRLIGLAGAAVFAWKAVEMVMKERYSMVWLILIGAFFFAGFLIGGITFFTWLYKGVCALAGGCA
ncbi:MAG TPA: hypothetical protein VD969_17340 [Symbiobacteriaceae bacterium]|nr:hypothetical protein [Symbiobacteriaceae bacterium]